MINLITKAPDKRKIHRCHLILNEESIRLKVQQIFELKNLPISQSAIEEFFSIFLNELDCYGSQEILNFLDSLLDNKIINTEKFMHDVQQRPVYLDDYIVHPALNSKSLKALTDFYRGSDGKGEYLLALILPEARKILDNEHGDIIVKDKKIEVKGRGCTMSSQTSHGQPSIAKHMLFEQIQKQVGDVPNFLKISKGYCFSQSGIILLYSWLKEKNVSDLNISVIFKSFFGAFLKDWSLDKLNYFDECFLENEFDVIKWRELHRISEFNYYKENEGFDSIMFVRSTHLRFLMVSTEEDVKKSFVHVSANLSYCTVNERSKTMKYELLAGKRNA